MFPFYHESVPNSPGIYQIVCVTTGRFYIGSAMNLRVRRKSHFGLLQRNEHKNPKLQAAFSKYGPESFRFEILELVLVPEMLTAREQHYLDTRKPFGKHGFNLAPRADSHLGMKRTPESRERMSAWQRGRPSPNRGKKMSPEVCARMSLIRRGRKFSEEAKRHMAEAQTGRKHSIESREKRSQSLLGHVMSAEARAKIIAANTGRIASPETRANLSAERKSRRYASEAYASRRHTLIVTSPDGVVYVVHGIHQFAIDHGLDGSALTKVAKGKYRHHRGWTARYPSPDEL